jgi:hypothetical protein
MKQLSIKYNKATDIDLCKTKRVAEYDNGFLDEHKLILSSKSLKMISTFDASYVEHRD